MKNNEYNEEILIHIDNIYYIEQIQYWNALLESAKIKYAYLIRNKKYYYKAKEKFNNLPIYLASSPIDVETLLNKLPLHSILYTSHSNKNIHTCRFIEFNHIYIGGENSDRNSNISGILRIYDEIWCQSNYYFDKVKNLIDLRHLDMKVTGKPEYEKQYFKDNSKDSISIFFNTKNNGLIKIFSKLTSILYNYNIDIFSKNKSIKRKNISLLNNEKINGLYVKLSSNVLKYNNEVIITDYDSYHSKLLLTNAIILIYIPEENDNFKNEKYLPINSINIFRTTQELDKLLLIKDELNTIKDEDIKYYHSNNMEEQFISNIRKLSKV